MILDIVICALVGYLFGSLSGSIIVSKWMYNADIREKGSGNAGLTNSIRIYGAPGALTTATIDVLKTVAALLIARYVSPEWGVVAGGAGVVLGHAFPVFFRFKGGKSAVCTTVVGLFIDYRMVLIALGVFAAVLLLTGIMSAATMSGMVTAAVSGALLHVGTAEVILISAAAVFVIFMHRGNIKRILNGTEKRLIVWGGKNK
ncbi:MAG: glycerol-3-phosphate acyltransferase [Clostridia bacterium]|nr:glycerol-3-phosphate acyltransferase [Clostridia bacterium]